MSCLSLGDGSVVGREELEQTRVRCQDGVDYALWVELVHRSRPTSAQYLVEVGVLVGRTDAVAVLRGARLRQVAIAWKEGLQDRRRLHVGWIRRRAAWVGRVVLVLKAVRRRLGARQRAGRVQESPSELEGTRVAKWVVE